MKRILVVDDEPQVGAALRRILRRAGYDVTAVTRPDEALDSFAHLCPDLVLSDYRMLGMDGLQLLEEIQKRHPGTPGVIVSGHADPEQLAGRFPLLPKPWDEAELLALVRTLLAE